MTYQFIQFSVEDGLAELTFNRPHVMNAWHEPMRNEVLDALQRTQNDTDISALVMTGAGDRAFSAGQDINESKEFDEDRAEQWIEEFRTLYGALRSLEKPVVAAVNGVAAGSAFQFVLLTDVRVGCADTRMGQPEINSGIASITGPWIMREILGLSRTIEMTLTGRLAEGAEALQLGLLHHVVEHDDLRSRAREIARELSTKPQLALRLNKRRFWEVLEPGFHEVFDAAIRYHRTSYAAGEPQDIGEQFLARRGSR